MSAAACIDCAPGEQVAALDRDVGAEENLLDPTTFVPPAPLPGPSIVIEFCDRVRLSVHASIHSITYSFCLRLYSFRHGRTLVSLVRPFISQIDLIFLIQSLFTGCTGRHGYLQSSSSPSPHLP